MNFTTALLDSVSRIAKRTTKQYALPTPLICGLVAGLFTRLSLFLHALMHVHTHKHSHTQHYPTTASTSYSLVLYDSLVVGLHKHIAAGAPTSTLFRSSPHLEEEEMLLPPAEGVKGSKEEGCLFTEEEEGVREDALLRVLVVPPRLLTKRLNSEAMVGPCPPSSKEEEGEEEARGPA